MIDLHFNLVQSCDLRAGVSSGRKFVYSVLMREGRWLSSIQSVVRPDFIAGCKSVY